MPAPDEMTLSQAKARIDELKEELERLRETNVRLAKRLDTDKVVQKIGELNLELGRAQAELKIIQERADKLQTAREVQDAEKMAISAALAEKTRDVRSAEQARDEAIKTLRVSQVALAARNWAPWIAAAVIVLIVLFLVARGIVIPRTGDIKEDVAMAINQLSIMEQDRRSREIDLQKPQQVWGISRAMTSDEGAVMSVQIWTGEKKYKKAQLDFVTSFVLTACRGRLAVMKPDGPDAHECFTVIGEPNAPQLPITSQVQLQAFLNEELGRNGLGLIQEKIPEFNLNIQVEFLRAPEQNRRAGFSFPFRDGKFADFVNNGAG